MYAGVLGLVYACMQPGTFSSSFSSSSSSCIHYHRARGSAKEGVQSFFTIHRSPAYADGVVQANTRNNPPYHSVNTHTSFIF